VAGESRAKRLLRAYAADEELKATTAAATAVEKVRLWAAPDHRDEPWLPACARVAAPEEATRARTLRCIHATLDSCSPERGERGVVANIGNISGWEPTGRERDTYRFDPGSRHSAQPFAAHARKAGIGGGPKCHALVLHSLRLTADTRWCRTPRSPGPPPHSDYRLM
jgi:hypothetical protein